MSNHANDKPGCLGGIFSVFGRRTASSRVEPPPTIFPYLTRDHFLTSAEISFYHVLSSVVSAKATICPKVRLADIFYVSTPDKNFSHFTKISSKHVDFVLCDPQTMRPILGIELDDKSHSRPDRQERDEFVKKTFEAAELPFLQIPVKMGYDPKELSSRLAQFIGITTADTSTFEAVQAPTSTIQTTGDFSSAPPLCPKCGIPMVIRTARQGKHQGEQFYGCANYPNCKEMLSVATYVDKSKGG